MSPNPLVVSMGDPAGIGPEITIKAWEALRGQSHLAFAVIAPPAVFEGRVPCQIIDAPQQANSIFASALPIIAIDGLAANAGQADPAHAPAITSSIERGVSLCLDGQAAGLVTCPIAKDILYKAGFSFPGHTEYLGHLCMGHDAPYDAGPVMMLAAQDLRVGLVTVHIALQVAALSLSEDTIIRTAKVMLGALTTDFGIAKPRLALTGLNPHAGEGGALGREEIDIINPAAAKLRALGHEVTDAQPADTLFHSDARQGYDAVLAMYHDQGLIPVKTLDFHGGVNITLGLPIVRTSPDHGTAFGIAGQGVARPDSLIAAIKTARQIANQRASHAVQ
ncbi:4-hydroxythreonine-4-phosphate dehydrogenase PdxA [Litorimonas sp. RW-G-Af-16]|uniref:4-hydroxythreonine-4-phosphate dehydrogenase PdxA n=1 Tax=Litorimonas sp. RW-G-Af-16 TaxID=3241168 RepID=UPI00390CCA1B